MGGGTVVFPRPIPCDSTHPSIWQTVADEGVVVLQIVGDAIGAPATR